MKFTTEDKGRGGGATTTVRFLTEEQIMSSLGMWRRIRKERGRSKKRRNTRGRTSTSMLPILITEEKERERGEKEEEDELMITLNYTATGKEHHTSSR